MSALRGEQSDQAPHDPLRLIADQAPILLAYCDRDRRFTFVNKAYAARFGQRPEEIVGRTIVDVVGREAYQRFGHHVDAALAGRSVEFELEIPYARIGPRIMHGKYVPDVDDAGAVRGLIAVLDDVTERRQAEQVRRTDEEVTRQVFESGQDCIKLLDLEGRLLRMSPGGQRLLCIDDVNSVLHRSWVEFWHGADREAARAAVAQAASGAMGRFEGFCATTTGVPKWWDVVVTPVLDASGRPERLLAISRDITERKHVEHALSEREERFRSLSVCSPVGIFTTDTRGRCVFTNPRCQAICGFSSESALGEGWSHFVHAEDRDRVRHDWFATASAGQEYSGEFRFVHPNGEVHWTTVRTAPIRSDRGELIGHVGTVEDVTDRKAAEAALRESESRLRQMADAVPQMVWMARPDGYLDYYNERWYDFTGFRRGEGGDESWKPVLHPEDVQRCVDTWYASVRTGQPYEIEYRFIDRRTGAYRWHLGRALPLRDEHGAIVRWFGTCTDIDDQKRAEQASRFVAEASAALGSLVDLESTLQAVARLAVPGFADWCTVDLASDDEPARRLVVAHRDPSKVAWAEALQRRYPLKADEPRGPRHVIRTGRPEFASNIDDAMLVAAARDEEHLRILRSLELRSYLTVPLTVGGRTIGALTFVTAESGRRYGPADLAVAEDLAFRAAVAIENARLYSELREAGRQKDEFLAVLAHELRNPLAPMRMALDLVRVSGDTPAAMQRARDVFDRQLRQMIRLVDDLLDVSRITRGVIDLQREPVPLPTVILSALETSRPAIDAAGHALDLAHPDEPLYVDADPTRLAQVFANLLNNAAKYTPRGGRIQIRAERQGQEAVVVVRDTGIGIPREMLTRVFEMFTQVDRSLEKVHGGLGIGLTLVKRIVELHGGTVEARSDGPGAGSEFVVRLPLARTGTREVAAATPAAASPGREPYARVLVVDDNRDAADMLAEALRLRGYEVRTAYDGRAAVAAVRDFAPAVVLFDLGMPELNGYDAACRIQADLGDRAPLLVAVSGWGQEAARRRSSEVGFVRHLVKPVGVDDVDAMLRELIGSEPGARPR